MKFFILTGSVMGLLLTGSVFANTNQVSTNVTPQQLNQSSSNYVGKQVSLSGTVDRVLGNGGYVISDSSNPGDSGRRVLIFVNQVPNQNMNSNMNQNTNSNLNQGNRQGAGAVGIKEGDQVKINGRVEQLNISSEVDSFSPKTDTETLNETSAAVPVVVVNPGNISRS